jgi:hypothetical protein
MCQNPVEDWLHVHVCPSLDASLSRADSWRLVKKGMAKCKIRNDFWITVKKGVISYTENLRKAKDMSSPATPFPMTFNSHINTLKVAFRAHSET